METPTLTYTNDDIAVYHGEALAFLRGLEDASVDLTITSPPYEDARTYNIDFKFAGMDWVMWAADRFMECYRVTMGVTAWVVEGRTSDFEYSGVPMLLAAELIKRGCRLRKPPIFRRVGIPGSGGPDWLRNDYEFIICATHGRLPWSDNTATGKAPIYRVGGACSNRTVDGQRINAAVGARLTDGRLKKVQTRRKPNGERARDGLYAHPKIANPGNFIEIEVPVTDPPASSEVIKLSVGGGQMGSKLAHFNEAPYPEALVEFFVRSFCPPGGIVCDPFSGSGTTAKTALVHGRKAIVSDIRADQVELTLRRIEEAGVVLA